MLSRVKVKKDNTKVTCILRQNTANVFDDPANQWYEQRLKLRCKAFTKTIERHSAIHSSDVIVTASGSTELWNEHKKQVSTTVFLHNLCPFV